MNDLTVFALAAGSYVATNVDNLALIVSWMLAGSMSGSRLFAGYAIGSVVILLASVVLGLSSAIIPVQWVGYLGAVPILLGLYTLGGLLRSGNGQNRTMPGNAAIAGIATTLVANSVDTMVVFAPLLADSRSEIDYVIVGGFIVVAALWFRVASLLSHHAARLEVITRLAGWLAPFIMISVGIYILVDTATDVV